VCVGVCVCNLYVIGLVEKRSELVLCSCLRFQVLLLLGTNNSMDSSDLDKVHELNVMYLQEILCLELVRFHD